MKKIENQFLDAYLKKAGIETDPQEKTTYRRRRLFVSLGAFAASACVLAVALSISLAFIPEPPRQTETGSAPGEEISVPYANVDVLADRAKTQVEYESNLSFVSDGLKIKSLDEKGKSKLIDPDEVDSSSFKEGVPGRYSIRLSSEEAGSTSYEVEVVEEEVVSIRVNFLRECYYVGETPLASDFSLVKVRSDTSSYTGKESEVGLDLSAYDPSKAGMQTIKVFLKGNPDFYEDVAVETKPLEEIDLSGTYAYIDDSMPFGSPFVRAFTINGNEIEEEYSEIVYSGPFDYVFHDDMSVELDGYGTNQKFIYYPSERSFTVTGVAGDPPMTCVEMGPKTAYLSVKSDIFTSSDLFCAELGYLNEETFNYLSYLGEGGVYLDPLLETSVSLDTYFPVDQTIYLGRPDSKPEGYASLLEGRYYLESNGYPYEVSMQFKDGKLYFGGYEGKNTPYVVTYESGIVKVRYEGGYFLYDVEKGTYEKYSIDGYFYGNLAKVDPERQVVVAVPYAQHTKEYVIDRGGSFPSYKISPDGQEIVFFHVDGYDGAPLFEDSSFDSGYQSTLNIQYDWFGHYGDYKDYWFLATAANFSRGAPNDGLYMGIYEDYELVDVGPVRISGYDAVNDCLLTSAAFEKAGEKELIFVPGNEPLVSMDGELRKENKAPFAGLPFVGSYVSGESRLDLRESGSLLLYLYNPETDYHYQSSVGLSIVEMDEAMENVTFSYNYHPDPNDWRFETRECSLRFEDGRYVLDYDGRTWTRENLAPVA